MSSPKFAAALLLALMVVTPARADSRQDLHAAFVRSQALKSYKATMTDLASKKTVSVVEYQAPDRFRVTQVGGPSSVIIGETMYMQAGGRSMKMPLPKGSLDQFRNTETIAGLQKAVIEDLGPGTVGKQAARKFRFKTMIARQQSTSTVWVGLRSGTVLQMDTAGKNAGRPFSMRVLYSDINSPAIRIAAPK